MGARVFAAALGLSWLAAAPPVPAAGQTVNALVMEARSLAEMEPREALNLLRRALILDSLDYEANWRAAIALVDLGQQTADSLKSAARDSLYLEAERDARRALRIDSTRVSGYFVLGMSLGRVALTKSRKDRVRYAKEIYEVATKALRLAPDHDGSHHILALWNAEAMRISGFSRFVAKNLLGGKILSQASWAQAIEHLETAVRIDPTRIFHRLDLAKIYVDRKRYSAAREQLNAIAGLPNRVALDPVYRREAAALLEKIAEKEDKKTEDR